MLKCKCVSQCLLEMIFPMLSFFAVLLQCLIENRIHVLEYLYSVQNSFFSLCYLGRGGKTTQLSYLSKSKDTLIEK
jgi:hypothetical protein